jgi:hypothetical protein
VESAVVFVVVGYVGYAVDSDGFVALVDGAQCVELAFAEPYFVFTWA